MESNEEKLGGAYTFFHVVLDSILFPTVLQVQLVVIEKFAEKLSFRGMEMHNPSAFLHTMTRNILIKVCGFVAQDHEAVAAHYGRAK